MEKSNPIFHQPTFMQKAFSCKVKHIPMKRAFDIVFSSCVLIAGLPVFLCLAVAVRLTSKGKAVYWQERVGRGGKPFKCYKFRTMHPDADHRLQEILAKDPILRQEWACFHKLKNDPRVTRLGAFLRKTSIDELPQFWNVLKGDLSVVGPRPVVSIEIEKHLTHKATKILSIRPGLTGPWQVSGRNNISYEERVKLDEFYVDNHTLWWDIWLVVRTIPAMIFSRGAY